MPADDGPVLAGATLRPPEVVDAIEGDKILGEVEEVQHLRIDATGELEAQRQEGTLRLLNPSHESLLWDVDVVLADDGETDLGTTHIPLETLEAGEKVELTYAIAADPVLELSIGVDTEPSRPQAPSLSVARASVPALVHMWWDLEHTGQMPVHDVRARWSLPSEAMLVEPPDGIRVGDDTVWWDIDQLRPGQRQRLEFRLSVPVTSAETVRLGRVMLDWQAAGTLSGLEVAELDAFCHASSRVDAIRDGVGRWMVRAVFENRSSFAVDPTLLELVHRDTGERVLHIEDMSEDIAPWQTWKSEPVSVASDEEPTFRHTLAYTALPRMATLTRGRIERTLPELPVVDATITANLSVTQLRPSRPRDVTATIDVRSNGSAPVNRIRAIIGLPDMVERVRLDDVMVTRGDGEALDPAHWSVATDVEDPEHGRALVVTTSADISVGLAKGEHLVIQAPLAVEPGELDGASAEMPVRVICGHERHGPITTRRPSSTTTMRVTHKKRRFSQGKELVGGTEPGSWRVHLVFRNRADWGIGELVLIDRVPPGCQVTGVRVESDQWGRFDPPARRVADEDGTRLEWRIARIEAGEGLDIIYEIEAEGEAEPHFADAASWFTIEGGDQIEG